MSSAAALTLLGDKDLEDALRDTPGMHDSFSALMDSIIVRRKDAKTTRLVNLKSLRDGLDTATQDHKYESLVNLYDNYSTVVKRDYLRVNKTYMGLVKEAEKLVKAAPSGLVKDKDSANAKNIFKAAKPGWIRAVAEPKTLTKAMEAFKTAAEAFGKEVLAATRDFDELKLDRVERVSQRDTVRDGLFAPGHGDAVATGIIGSREELAKQEDKFLEDLLDIAAMDTASLTTEVGRMNSGFNSLEHNVNEGRELWPQISNLFDHVGTGIFNAAVMERDFLNANKPPGQKPVTGILMKGCRDLINLLQKYESKAFGDSHENPTVSDLNMGAAFEAYGNRALAVIGGGEFHANKSENATFRQEITGTVDTRQGRLKAQLEAPR